MDERPGIPLDSLINDPNFDFFHQFNKFFDNDDDANTSPYGNLNINCVYLDEEQFVVKYQNIGNLSIMSINVQSLQAKFSELNEFISLLAENGCNPEIIALQELWHLNDPDIFILKDYQKLVFKSRCNNTQGGGVGFYIANNIKFTVRNDLSLLLIKSTNPCS